MDDPSTTPTGPTNPVDGDPAGRLVEPPAGVSPFERLRDEITASLIAEGNPPHLSAVLGTLTARFETEVPSTMQDLRSLLGTLNGFFGNGGGGRVMKMLGIGR